MFLDFRVMPEGRECLFCEDASHQVPVYVYTLPISLNGAKALARQWQWDRHSGSTPSKMASELLTH